MSHTLRHGRVSFYYCIQISDKSSNVRSDHIMQKLQNIFSVHFEIIYTHIVDCLVREKAAIA